MTSRDWFLVGAGFMAADATSGEGRLWVGLNVVVILVVLVMYVRAFIRERRGAS